MVRGDLSFCEPNRRTPSSDRISRAVGRTDAEVIRRPRVQTRRSIACEIRAQAHRIKALRERRIRRIIQRKSRLVAAVVQPGEIDLAGRDGRCRDTAWSRGSRDRAAGGGHAQRVLPDRAVLAGAAHGDDVRAGPQVEAELRPQAEDGPRAEYL